MQRRFSLLEKENFSPSVSGPGRPARGQKKEAKTALSRRTRHTHTIGLTSVDWVFQDLFGC